MKNNLMSLKTLLPALFLVFMVTSTAHAGTPVPESPDFSKDAQPYSSTSGEKLDLSFRQPSIGVGISLSADRYGYTFDDSLSPAWIDLAGLGAGEFFVAVKTQVDLQPVLVQTTNPQTVQIVMEPLVSLELPVELNV